MVPIRAVARRITSLESPVRLGLRDTGTQHEAAHDAGYDQRKGNGGYEKRHSLRTPRFCARHHRLTGVRCLPNTNPYDRVSADYFARRGLRRYAGVASLWALGVGAVISGHYSAGTSA